MGRFPFALICGLVMVLVCSLGSIAAVYAHGTGEPLLAHEPVGPYILYVWIEPWPAETGEMHVTVSVNEPLPDKPEQTYPILHADVTLRAEPVAHEAEVVQAQATHEKAVNKLFYEGHLFLATPGQWTLYLEIRSEAGTATHEWILDVGGDNKPVQRSMGHRIMNWFRNLFRRG